MGGFTLYGPPHLPRPFLNCTTCLGFQSHRQFIFSPFGPDIHTFILRANITLLKVFNVLGLCSDQVCVV